MSSVKSDSDFDEVNNVDNITEILETVGQEGNGSTELSPEGETISFSNNFPTESGIIEGGEGESRPRTQIAVSLNSSEELMGSDVTTVTLA